jgi:hypothetical protein
MYTLDIQHVSRGNKPFLNYFFSSQKDCFCEKVSLVSLNPYNKLITNDLI